MVDRLEELLTLLEAEDEEEREDGLEIRWAGSPARPAPEAGKAPDPEDEAGFSGGGPETEVFRDRGPGPAQAGGPERDGAEERAGEALRELTAAAQAAQRQEGEGRDAGRADSLPRLRREAGSGLEELYRRTARAVSPAALALPVEQAGRVWPAEEPGRSAALAVDELDRAVRRDSRRYDGGMSIF